jgi:hypothetical protein
MISLIAPKRSHAIEHCQMFNSLRTSWLNPASENLFDAGYRDLDYNYEPSRQDYEPGRLVRSPEERNFRVIGAANQWLQPVPQKMSTTTSGVINRIFYQPACDYNAVSGVFIWPNRDPLNAATGTEARFELLQDYGFDDETARSVAENPADLNDYIFAHNQPVVDYDLFGLCVSLPDSGSGSISGSDPIHIGLHKWGKHHHLPPGWGGAATITFKVCCPATVQYLKTWGETALQTVVGTPPPTLNGNTFPYSVQSGPSGSGPCYTIVLEVPSTTATEYWTGTSSYANFLSTIRIVGQCCCSSSGSPTQNNPPPLPPLPPPPRHGSGN